MPERAPLTPNVADEFLPPPMAGEAVLPPPPTREVQMAALGDIEMDEELPPPSLEGLDVLPPPPTLLSTPGLLPGVSPTIVGAKSDALPPPPGVQMAADEDIELVEEAAPQLTAVQEAEQRAVEQAGQLDRQAGQLDQLESRRTELIADYALAKTPEERKDLEKRLGAITEADRNVRASQQATRDGIQESAADLQARVGQEQQQLQNAAAESIVEKRQEIQADADAARLRRESELEALQGQLQTDRDALRDVFQAGATSVNMGQVITEIMGETLRATLSKGVPNYGAIMDRANKQNQAAYKQRAQARMDEIGLTGDAIRDSQRLRDEEQAQAKAGEVEMLASVEAKLQRDLETATQPLDRVRVATTLESVRVERMQREQQAIAARQEADRRRAKEDADLALVRAKEGTELARGSKLEAEAIKAARRGMGGRGKPGGALPGELSSAIQSGQLSKKDAKMVFQQGVIDPATGEYMRRGDGSFAVATNSKNATDLNEAIALTQTTNGLLNEALAMRGTDGWEPTHDWYSSDAGKRMAALSTHLLLLNKGTFDLGAMSEGDAKMLGQIQGGDLAGMKDPRPALRDLQRRTAEALNTRLRSMVPGGKPLAFTRVKSAPAATVKSLTTRLTQGPRLQSEKIVPTARERIAGVEQMRELAIAESGGDVAAAAAVFTERMAPIIKRGKAHEDELLEEVRKVTPAGYDPAQWRMVTAAGDYERLKADEDTTGKDLEDAADALAQAQADARKLETPRFRKVADALEEQRVYVRDASALTVKDVAALKNKAALERAKVEQAEQRFEAGQVVSGGKVGAF